MTLTVQRTVKFGPPIHTFYQNDYCNGSRPTLQPYKLTLWEIYSKMRFFVRLMIQILNMTLHFSTILTPLIGLDVNFAAVFLTVPYVYTGR